MNDEIVSIVVLTYNSADSIVSLLDSISNQTYKELELVISDDKSVDNTCEIIEKWLVNNQSRFKNVILIKNPVNVGVTANFNNSINAATSEWIKIIAGDDLLIETCIADFMSFVSKNKDAHFVVSNMISFNSNGEKPINSYSYAYCKLIGKMKSAEDQYKELLKEDLLVSPSAFFSKTLVENTGGADIRIRNIEDWSFRLKATKCGFRIFFLDKPTVKYRVGEDSISHSKDEFFNQRHVSEVIKIRKLLIYPNVNKSNLFFYWNDAVRNLRYNLIIKKNGNKKNVINKVINTILLLFQPYTYKKIIQYIRASLF